MAGETKVLEFAEGTEVTATEQSFLATSTVVGYANDAAYVTAKTEAAAEGDFYSNTTLNFLRHYNGTAWVSLVNDTDAQTIAGVKTFSTSISVGTINEASVNAGVTVDDALFKGGRGQFFANSDSGQSVYGRRSDTGLSPSSFSNFISERNGTNYFEFMCSNTGFCGHLFQNSNDTYHSYFDGNTSSFNIGIGLITQWIKFDSSGAHVDQIQELTADAGVGIEGLLLKDSLLAFVGDPDTYISNPAANELAITTGGTERVRYSSAGVEIKTGGLELPNGGTASSGTPTSSVFNWYEEGEFTPSLTDTGGNSATTYTTRVGEYTREGDVVFCDVMMVITNIGTLSGGGNPLRISGLPFAINNMSGYFPGAAISEIGGITLPNYQLVIFGNQGGSTCGMVEIRTAAGVTSLTGSSLAASVTIRFSIAYKI